MGSLAASGRGAGVGPVPLAPPGGRGGLGQRRPLRCPPVGKGARPFHHLVKPSPSPCALCAPFKVKYNLWIKMGLGTA